MIPQGSQRSPQPWQMEGLREQIYSWRLTCLDSALFLSWHSVLTASLPGRYDRRRGGPGRFRCGSLPEWEAAAAAAAAGFGPVWRHISALVSHKDFGGPFNATKQSQWGVASLLRMGDCFIRELHTSLHELACLLGLSVFIHSMLFFFFFNMTQARQQK